jgi:ABC-2 type transport system permease protein
MMNVLLAQETADRSPVVEVLIHFAIPTVVVSALFIIALIFLVPREVRTVFKRELKSYFLSPVAYVCIVVFLVASNGLAFLFGGLLDSGEASLTRSYFTFIPWCFVFIMPAVGMRLWSDEQRTGTMELLLTMPIVPWHAILGKYLAAGVVLFGMLVLSFPIVMAVNYLGAPDNGVILSAFVASFLVGMSFLSVASFVSAMTQSQIVALLVSISICLLLFLGGWPRVAGLLPNLDGALVVFWLPLKAMSLLSVTPHFDELSKGVLSTSSMIFFVSFIAFCLFLTSVVIRLKRS